jgi:hypothetical protein
VPDDHATKILFGEQIVMLDATKLSLYPADRLRANVDSNLVMEYATAMIEGADFPPILVFREVRDGAPILWLADGANRAMARVLAHESEAKAGRSFPPMIAAEVREGTRADAIRAGCAINRKHGKRPTAADFERAYRTALEAGLLDVDRIDAVAPLVQAVVGCSLRVAQELSKPLRDDMRRVRNARIVEMAGRKVPQEQIAKEVGITEEAVRLIVKAIPTSRVGAETWEPSTPPLLATLEEQRADAPEAEAEEPEDEEAAEPVEPAPPSDGIEDLQASALSRISMAPFLPTLVRYVAAPSDVDDVGTIPPAVEASTPQIEETPATVEAIGAIASKVSALLGELAAMTRSPSKPKAKEQKPAPLAGIFTKATAAEAAAQCAHGAAILAELGRYLRNEGK